MPYIGNVTTSSNVNGSQINNGTITGDKLSQPFDYDSTTLYLDATNNRVGIGTSSPTVQLQVIGGSTIADPVIRATNSGLTQSMALTSAGLRMDGSAPIQIYQGGSEVVRIDTSGRVGIGTASPLGTLHLKHATDANIFFRNGTAASLSTGTLIDCFNDTVSTTTPLYFRALQFQFGTDLSGNFIPRLTINSSGQVGIGTTSPGVKVDIVSENNTSLASVLRVNSNNVAVNTSLAYDGLVGSGQLTIQAGASSALIFGSNATERLRIDSSGRVGIGTTSPGALLEIYAATNPELRLNTSADGYLQIGQFTNGAFIGPSSSDSVDGVLRLGTGGTERLRIDSSGRVGIGTSSPAANLDVASTGAATNVIVSRSTAGGTAYLSAAGNGSAVGSTSFDFIQDGTGIGYVYNRSAQPLLFGTNNTERLRIDSSGNVGIGTTSPTLPFVVSNAGAQGFEVQTISGTLSGGIELISYNRNTSAYAPCFYSSSYHAFAISNSEKARIDSSGRLLVGSSSARSLYGQTGVLQTEGTSYASSGINLILNNASTAGPLLMLGKSRGSTNGSNTIVLNNDILGEIYFCGADGSDLDTPGGLIRCVVDGTPGSNDMPGRLEFCTTADNAASPTERMRIRANGNVSIDKGLAIGASIDPGLTISISNLVLASGAGTHFIKWNSISGVLTYDTSSRVVKENIVDCPYGIDAIKLLQPRKYFRTDDQREEIGFIADEVVQVMPEFVPLGPKSLFTKNEEDVETIPVGVNYDRLSAVLTKALQEAIAKIETLEARLTAAGIV